MKESRIYNLDENKFEKIDSEEKAYWLGFIMGDGCITDRSLIIDLGTIDVNHIAKFLKFMNTNYRIKERKSKGTSRVSLNSIKLVSDLAKYGIVPKKTYKKIKTPNIEKYLIRHFYRGLWDADGWLVGHKYKYAIYPEFGFSSYYQDILLEIKNWISEEVNYTGGTLLTRKRDNQQCSQFIVTGKNIFRDIGYLFYYKSNIFLTRKYEKYLELLPLTIPTK